MELRRIFQNILSAEYHGTFHDTRSNKMLVEQILVIIFKTSLDEQEMMSLIYVFPQ
jgi:hypothetical protein